MVPFTYCWFLATRKGLYIVGFCSQKYTGLLVGQKSFGHLGKCVSVTYPFVFWGLWESCAALSSLKNQDDMELEVMSFLYHKQNTLLQHVWLPKSWRCSVQMLFAKALALTVEAWCRQTELEPSNHPGWFPWYLVFSWERYERELHGSLLVWFFWLRLATKSNMI